MNFTFTIEHVKTFGGLKDGKWTGMIGNNYQRLELAIFYRNLLKNCHVYDYFFIMCVQFQRFIKG